MRCAFEEWMPNYINEFDGNRRAEQESRRSKTEAELEREQEGVYKECQELLRLCGIPFVVSPGEAEAQCCELERLGLVQVGSLYCRCNHAQAHLVALLICGGGALEILQGEGGKEEEFIVSKQSSRFCIEPWGPY
ncbi:unnamed protein product [Toxocara canis]|uniref:XPGI domain-containing protein n=1 Tax=Toxocara canis TaxID=6265 RepID=A0A183U977_TOXCA|nr:unnamed protein product [Toxocara canis]